MYLKELARSGEALFRVRGNYLISMIIVGAMIAFFSGATASFASTAASKAWYRVSPGVASDKTMIRIVTSGYDALNTSGLAETSPSWPN